MSPNPAADTGTDTALVITRVFDAPPEAVFALWSDPEHVREWWHPPGFTTPEYEMDFRAGGAWRFRCSGDRDVSAHGVYESIVPPRRIVMTFRWDTGAARDDPPTRIGIDFEPLPGGRTRFVFRQEGLASAASRDLHVAGWSGLLDGFERALADAGVRA